MQYFYFYLSYIFSHHMSFLSLKTHSVAVLYSFRIVSSTSLQFCRSAFKLGMLNTISLLLIPMLIPDVLYHHPISVHLKKTCIIITFHWDSM